MTPREQLIERASTKLHNLNDKAERCANGETFEMMGYAVTYTPVEQGTNAMVDVVEESARELGQVAMAYYMGITDKAYYRLERAICQRSNGEMKSEIATTKQGFDFVPASASKNRKSQLTRFETWARDNGQSLLQPDLAAYRDYLLEKVSPTTARQYLSTIRARYAELMHDNTFRDLLFDKASEQTDNPLERQAIVNEILVRLGNGTHHNASTVKVEKKQDVVDSEHIRLTKAQADALLQAPGLVPLSKLRDTAIIGLFLCTGVREGELVSLDVKDLRQKADGKLALHVRNGKGNKTRVVFYGQNQGILRYIDAWLDRANITEGPVFRGFYRGQSVRPTRLTTRAIQKIIGSYPVMIDGQSAKVKPHDLRRTYARLCYEAGMDLLAISQNLGHSSIEITLRYIGILDASKRQAPSLYTLPYWSELDKLS